MSCIAIVLSTGRPCTRDAVPNETRCKVHLDSLNRHGPHSTQRKELKAIYEKHDLANLKIDKISGKLTEREYLTRRYDVSRAFRDSMAELIRNQLQEIRITGVDPDEQANERKLIRREQLRIQRQQRIVDAIRAEAIRAEAIRAEAVAYRELAKFAMDPQNVHTTIMVEQTKKIIEKIRSVAVPEEYRWNTQSCSKTPGEIILTCKLSPNAAWQMISKYANPEPIYDIEEGIYGKVLDSVWQYVINSPEKESLVAIVRTELEDNIGMCAQGNLTRICNILSGYMEGVGPAESPAEILGRQMPKVAEIDDINERVKEATRVLQESGLPITEWMKWTVALFEDEVVDVRDNKLVLV